METPMKPGRELDALVAEKVMGCKVFARQIVIPGTSCMVREAGKERVEMHDDRTLYICQCDPAHIHNENNGQLPEYSTDIAAAWIVVEWIRKHRWRGILTLAGPSDETTSWWATFEHKWHGRSGDNLYDWEPGETASHAICLAALKT